MITEQLRAQLETDYDNGHRYLVISRFAGTCYLIDHNEHNPATCYVVVLDDGLEDVVAEILTITAFEIDHTTADVELTACYVDACLRNNGVLATVLVACDADTMAPFIQVVLSPTNYTRQRAVANAVAYRATRESVFYVNVV